MIKTILQIVLILLRFAGLYAAKREETKPERTVDDHVQAARKALAKNDGAAVDSIAADQHDRVQQALRGRQG